MSITKPLFEGKLVRLGPIDHEKDPEIESRWTHDPAFMRLMYTQSMRPLSVFQLKKNYEALEKEIDDERSLYHFRIRAISDDRLLGFGEIRWIMWSNATAHIRLGIGDPADWRKGYGSDALALLLRYAFHELNLYRLTAVIPAYNEPALSFFAKAGFTKEVQRRESLFRDGRRWDSFNYGLLAEEWRPDHD